MFQGLDCWLRSPNCEGWHPTSPWWLAGEYLSPRWCGLILNNPHASSMSEIHGAMGKFFTRCECLMVHGQTALQCPILSVQHRRGHGVFLWLGHSEPRFFSPSALDIHKGIPRVSPFCWLFLNYPSWNPRPGAFTINAGDLIQVGKGDVEQVIPEMKKKSVRDWNCRGSHFCHFWATRLQESNCWAKETALKLHLTV